MRLYIGFDDTDSRDKGFCTTYLGALLVEKLAGLAELVGYPRLVRLNPNNPYKTRGNASVVLCVDVEKEKLGEVKNVVLDAVKENAIFSDENTNPGVVFLEGEPTKPLHDFYRLCLNKIVTIEDAEVLAKKTGAECHKFKNGRGIVGALAGTGWMCEPHTYELISYRVPKNRGTKRRISEESVIDMDRKTYPQTFDNYNYPLKHVCICPNAPCPIFSGIRGENPEIISRAWEIVEPKEEIERFVVFITNQSTDDHFILKKIAEAEERENVVLNVRVTSPPRGIKGRHVCFKAADDTGEIDVFAYEPTHELRDHVRHLIRGDLLEIYGAARKEEKGFPKTINLEKFLILELAPDKKLQNPVCKACNKSMKSEGVGQGFKCKKCGAEFRGEKMEVINPRAIEKGWYETPPGSRRHLTMPLCRKGINL